MKILCTYLVLVWWFFSVADWFESIKKPSFQRKLGFFSQKSRINQKSCWGMTLICPNKVHYALTCCMCKYFRITVVKNIFHVRNWYNVLSSDLIKISIHSIETFEMQQRLFYFGCLLLLTQLSACHMNRAQTSNQSVQKAVLLAPS